MGKLRTIIFNLFTQAVSSPSASVRALIMHNLNGQFMLTLWLSWLSTPDIYVL